MKPVRVYGDPEADLTLIGWGSTKGPVLEAIRILRRNGVKARFVQVVYMEPFPTRELGTIFKSNGTFILFETNMTSQLGKLIKFNTGFEFEHLLLKYNGRPFKPDEIYAKVEEVL